MENCTLKVSLMISLHLLLFSLFTCSPIAVSSSNSTITPLDGDVSLLCALITCGQGKCVSGGSLLGFDCECNPGWKKMQLGPLTFPSCIVPNCTINFDCGNGGPAAPPPPFSFPLPSLNLSDHCNLVWCGEGTCVSNGKGHTCQCNEGSANLFNKTDLACFKQCFLGADCDNLGLGLGSPPPPSPSTGSSNPSPAGNGTTGATNSSSNKLRAFVMTLLAAAFLPWL